MLTSKLIGKLIELILNFSELSARSNDAGQGVKRFLKLCIFGYGVPAGFVGIGLAIFSVT